MFKKAILAKFEWEGLPDPLNELFVENLIYESSEENFAVTMHGDKEFWSLYNVLGAREEFYGLATQIQVTTARGTTKTTDDFCLFSQFKKMTVPIALYVHTHSELIANINRALSQNIRASELICNIYANGQEEAQELKKLYQNFNGIKILQQPKGLDRMRGVELVQFEITAGKMSELEELKHELQNDLFLRVGIYTGIDKSHLTDHNIKSCEQVEDLINAYELKRREDFCKRYNKWLSKHGIDNRRLSVKIHAVTAENSISDKQSKPEETTE